MVRYSNTVVGIVPTQIDYSDYREVAGIKMPFHWTVTWTDGKSTIELSDVQPDVRIDASKFTQPVVAVVKSRRSKKQLSRFSRNGSGFPR